MATDVVMPQMGESIAEGTIVRWIKKVGDKVDRDEPLFEISTDKVDAEIPSPAAGVVSEIRVQEGETVAVNSIVAVIGSAVAPTPAPNASEPQPAAPPTHYHDRDEPVAAATSAAPARPAATAGHAGPAAKSGSVSGAPPVAQVTFPPGASDHIEKMSVMRKRISEHMVQSVKTSAHVHSVFEVNFGRIAKIREAKKAEFERAGAKLTYMSFIIKAAIDALRAVPIVNASVDGDNIVYHKDINVGIAVALDWGLIVPVIKHADEKNLVGLSRAVVDLANRARGKQLKPDEVAGGTFTITNPGVFGALFGMPIISQPQVAILGIGHVEKRPVVVDDAIAIRPMAYLTLGYDHRVIDKENVGTFWQELKKLRGN